MILVIAVSGCIIYINQVILPTRIKDMVIKGIEDATGKKASLGSLRFSILKGLVFRDLSISDGARPIFSLKEGSCTFLILPIFKKSIIFPTVRLRSPEIFLKRQADNSLNIQDLFLKKSSPETKGSFNILFYKLTVTDARINFQDQTFTPVFTKQINNLDLAISLSLPGKVKFNFNGEITADTPIKIGASGEYNIASRELAAEIIIKDASPDEFAVYYTDSGFTVPDGKIDADANLKLKDKILNVDLDVQGRSLAISKEKISAVLNSAAKANLRYSLEDGQLEYCGSANISDSALCGIEFIEKIDGIRGDIEFSNNGLSSENLKANLLGVPIDAKMNLVDFSNPLLKLNIASTVNLNTAQGILKDKFKIDLPVQAEGQGRLSLMIESGVSVTAASRINGVLEILNSTLRFQKAGPVFENINGKFKFTPEQLTWSDLNFKYLGINYKSEGSLNNFQAPAAQFKLASQDLNLESALTINGKVVKFSKFTGRYINSKFSLAAGAEVLDATNINADINGSLDIDLKDLGAPLNKFKKQLDQIKPAGVVHLEGSFEGNVSDIKSAVINVKLSSDSLSAYGLKATDFSLNYDQENGIADMGFMHLSLYDGACDAAGKMNLSSENLPFWLSVNIQGVNLEKLKMDTPAKNNDISGTLKADVKINGFSGNLSRLSGAGNVFITEGKLWQLNLFKGLGKLIFAKDFANVVFSEGYCGFIIQDESIFTDSLKLKSNLVDLSGKVKIGFDTSIAAAINIRILDKMIPLTNSFKDVIAAIIGESEIFGVIRITGTLQEPKYKFQAAVTDMIKGLKDSVLGNIFKFP